MRKHITKAAALILVLAVLCGCGKNKNEAVIPYSEANFATDLDTIIEIEGSDYETYDSIYYGTTYTYSKDYLGHMGKIKYMMDDTEELCNVAWTFVAEDGTEAENVYKEVYDEIVKAYGEPKDNKGVNNMGAVWKKDSGNIILSAVISSEANIVQVAFLNPKVSRDEDGKLTDSTNTK